jgi:GNAT superfamily N-acetyltransferase
MRIVEATAAEDLRKAAALLRAFPQHQRQYYTANLDTVLRYFDPVAYEQEVSDLPAHYGPPRGCVLLATDDDDAAGVVCLRPLDAETCEMKRLFVPVAHRRKGIAQALCTTLLHTARDKGYTTMCLDTGFFMTESQALYRKLGFTYTSAYQPVREELRDQLVFMQLHL